MILEEYDGITVLSVPVFLSLSLSLSATRNLSLIRSNQKHSLTADKPERTIDRKGICAFMGGTEAPIGKNYAVFSVPAWLIPSCIQQTQ